jgi:transposase
VASEPVALIAWLGSLGLELTRIGLEAGPLSQWLYAGMREAGLVVELLETRHVRNAFKIMPVKTDRKDAHGIAELMRLGWMSSGTVERSTAAPDSSATTGLRPAPQLAAPALGRLGAIDRLLHGGRRRLLAGLRPAPQHPPAAPALGRLAGPGAPRFRGAPPRRPRPLVWSKCSTACRVRTTITPQPF